MLNHMILSTGSKRRVCAAIALSLLAALPVAAVQQPDAAHDDKSLAGQFLIAAPTMGDPRFSQSVILMVKHDKSGAFGLIINRPSEERSLSELLKSIGEPDADVPGSVQLYVGGPVQPKLGFVVHSAEYRRPETVAIGAGHVAMTASREIMQDIAQGKGPKRKLVIFGYSGWGPGQLENEMSRGDWFTAPAENKLIFDEDRDKIWDSAMARRTRDL